MLKSNSFQRSPATTQSNSSRKKPLPWLSCKTWASASSRRQLPTHTLTRQSAFMSSLLWGPSKSLISISCNSFVSCSDHNLLIPPDALYSQPQGAAHGPHCHDSAPCRKSQVSSHRLHASTSPSLFTAPATPDTALSLFLCF